ncbi:MAG: hypothetical protein BWY21_02145 [Parcubacteria group bacterium ADurb.Bin216]|nr:MAG: hypothetical protein BWY21_02145 [Parcubacteria group bacterium ADurb.Bin216]
MGRRQTEKQKQTIKYMAQGMDRYHAMLKAGYKKSYARNSTITQSETWQELIDKYIPEKKITEAVDSLMNYEFIKDYTFNKKYSEEEVIEKMAQLGFSKDKFVIVEDVEYKNVNNELVAIDYWRVMTKIRDPMAISNGTEKAIRIRGRYAPEQLELRKTKYADLSDKELDELIAQKERELNVKKEQ